MSRSTIVLIVIVAALAACAGRGDRDAADRARQTEAYSKNGVRFEYPEGWDRFPAQAAAASTGSSELWSATIGPDRTNLVSITAYGLNIEITEENLGSVESELNEVIEGVVDRAGGAITSGPTVDEIAGLPAYTYTWEGIEVNGQTKDTLAYFLFAGTTEYFVSCQFSDAVAAEVERGCDLVLETFEVTEPNG